MPDKRNDPRRQMVSWLTRELVGPDLSKDEILTSDPPLSRYGTGILFPQLSKKDEVIADTRTPEQIELELEQQQEEEGEVFPIPAMVDSVGTKWKEEISDDDAEVELSNGMHQSAMGISLYMDVPAVGVQVHVTAGHYTKEKSSVILKSAKEILKNQYRRSELDETVLLDADVVKMNPGQHCELQIKDSTLHVNIRCRAINEETGRRLMTFTLINRGDAQGKQGLDDNERCWFQCNMSVSTKDGQPFVYPYPEGKRVIQDEDSQSNRLLFRNHHTWAVGHGCAAKWAEPVGVAVAEVSTSVLPDYEMKPVVPSSLGVVLDMQMLSDPRRWHEALEAINTLCNEYQGWISLREQELDEEKILTADSELYATAKRHLCNCKTCLGRMRAGVRRLEDSSIVRKAFSLMNHAMLVQQLHYALDTRKWFYDENTRTWKLDKVAMPSLDDRSTWPGQPGRYGTWRPFQLAFILMNLLGMDDMLHPEHAIVDLIWFPTGGGKTEAYLGLTAFILFLRRLKNRDDRGTAVIMRYTLRLLTMQQYERAASLICACEMLRRSNHELGPNRISIGLWIGPSTPSTRTDAVAAFNRMYREHIDENPFVVLKCPWCGAQMGPVNSGNKSSIKGYHEHKENRRSRIVFQCDDPDCVFSHDENLLPMKVVDEDIYNEPPSLLFGTVDKFAMIPWRGEARSLFGRDPNRPAMPPDLIIQDELHLISGPLGSMVGHYETMINALCTRKVNGQNVSAKVIASTATISRAREQANALYNCGRDNVFVFPPQCLETNESFFAHVDTDAEGRLYIGVHASAMSSQATAQTRIMASLLQSVRMIDVENEMQRDPYWTAIYYFNSLRELGHAATMLYGDIPQYLNAMYLRYGLRRGEAGDSRRFINNTIELTSRISNSEVPEFLHELSIPYSDIGKQQAIDVCLATNMISVGLDVSRLGLMVVIGQPKTTSEYIQATSRVGRSKGGPGLVITVYNPSKPRDRSHYEHFVSYHDTIYSKVEPTSITAFSIPVRDRAIHALLVGLVRMLGSDSNNTSPRPLPDQKLFDTIVRLVEERVEGVDPDEKANTIALLQSKIDEWKRNQLPIYGNARINPFGDVPMMYPAGMTPLETWEGRGWPTQMAMRNVDEECEASVCAVYPRPTERR